MVDMSSTYNTWINITIKYKSGLNHPRRGDPTQQEINEAHGGSMEF